MHLFSKKNLKDLEKQYQQSIEMLDERYKKTIDRDRGWLKELLEEKSNLETKLKLTQKDKSKLEEKIKNISDDYENLLVKVEKLEKEGLILKEKGKNISCSYGGTVKQNRKLLKQVGELELYCRILEEKLKKNGIRKPTMQDFQEYEITHKSPFKKEKQEEGKTIVQR